MKVLITATVQSHICQFHRPLADMLHAHGVEVHAAARDNLAEKNGLKLDFVDKVFDVPFSRSPKSSDNIRAYKELKKIIDKGGYDIVHCNTPVGGVITRMAAKDARKRGMRVFYTAHGFHFYKGAPKKNWNVFYPIERFMANRTDKIITINTEDFELAKRRFSCEVCYIHGVGVDASRYSVPSAEESSTLRVELGFSSSQPIVLCVGELLPNKNQRMAIFAMADVCKQYPDAILLLAGNGSEKEHLEELIAQLGLQKNVYLLGYCTCLEKYQKCADMAVACSKREGLPLNIVEAQLTGVPVVASDNRGHRDLIIDGETGFLVPVDDAKAMATKMIRLLADSELRSSMAARAREHANMYSSEQVSLELMGVYGLDSTHAVKAGSDAQ